MSAGAVTLRRAGPGDAEALSVVGAATFLESFADVLPGADVVAHCRNQHAVERYAGWLEAGVPAWIAEAAPGAAPVGYAILTKPDLPLPDISASDIEVKRIYLLGRFQGRGIGRALMSEAEAEARRLGMGRLLLGVYGRNDKAIGFYKATGFEVVGTRRFSIGAGTYDDLVFAKAVASSPGAA